MWGRLRHYLDVGLTLHINGCIEGKGHPALLFETWRLGEIAI